MSLINDALKRAKAVQQATPPPLPESTLHLRPAEPEANVRHGIGYATPVVFAAIALLVLFFVWRFAQQRGSNGGQTPSDGSREAQTAPAAGAAASDVTPVRARAREQQSTAPVAATGTAIPSPAVAVTGAAPATSNVAQVVAPSESVTNAVALPVSPPPLKLQGVVFDPRRPSAVINGKTVFVGDRMGAMRVSSIRSDSVTLVGGGKTNVLSLEQ